MVRQFKIINSLGQEFDLMRKDAFFHKPSGLGFSRTLNTERLGYDFQLVEDELDEKVISGEMILKGYETYTELIKFLSFQPLTFCYKPQEEWYYIDCRLQQIVKSEIDYNTSRLFAPIDLLCLGTWYRTKTYVISASGTEEEGKEYDYEYDYSYTSSGQAEVNIVNDGELEGFARISIQGEAVNPSWALYVDGVLQGRGSITKTIPSGHKLVIDSNPLTMEIAEYSNDGELIDNLYRYSDFSTTRFLKIPVGSSKLVIDNNENEVLATVEVRMLEQSV